MELRLSWVDAHIDAGPLKDCSRCIRWQEGDWHPEKQPKVEGRPVLWYIHGKCETSVSRVSRPPALHHQSLFFSSNHFSLTQQASERHKDPELPSSSRLPAPKSLIICDAEVPLAAAFSGPVCAPPPPYFLCQSLSNIRTHCSHRRFSVREPAGNFL